MNRVLLAAFIATAVIFGMLAPATAEEQKSTIKPKCFWYELDVVYGCYYNSSSPVGVIQFGLDELDIQVLQNIWLAHLNGTYVYPPEAGSEKPQNQTTYPFADTRNVTDEQLSEQEDNAHETQCTNNLYLPNYKRDRGCKMHVENGTWYLP